MGGSYSNHIYAVAAAGKRFNFKTIGIIRGQKPKQLSPTLSFAHQAGMQLHFVSRTDYRALRNDGQQSPILDEFQPAYFIPEGGSTPLAVDSCAEFISPLSEPFDIVCCACGTGGTLAGFIKGLNNQAEAIGFAALKNANFLNQDIRRLLNDGNPPHRFDRWQVNNDYHFGGYAKSSIELENFIIHFYQQHKIRLEPVYTGKMFFGLYDLIKRGYFKEGTRILAIHTGGLQGLGGFPALKQALE